MNIKLLKIEKYDKKVACHLDDLAPCFFQSCKRFLTFIVICGSGHGALAKQHCSSIPATKS